MLFFPNITYSLMWYRIKYTHQRTMVLTKRERKKRQEPTIETKNNELLP